jgi:hypothetical protein
VDETTAVVRFILPIPESRVGLGSTFAAPSELPPSEQLTPYIDTARELFIAFFVENVILNIHGEDEI